MANPTLRQSSSNFSAAADSTPIGNKPTGTANGDALFACVFTNGSGTNPTITTVPSGWTLLDTTTSSTNVRMSVYWKIAASEPTTWSWGTSGNVAWIVQVTAVQNPGDAVTPTDVSGIQANASSANVVAPSVTTTLANGLMVGFFGTHITTTFTPDGSMTEVQDAQCSSLASLETAWEARASTGATGTRTAVAGSAAANIGWLGVVKGPSASGTPIAPHLFWSL